MRKLILPAVIVIALYFVATSAAFHHDTDRQRVIALALAAGIVIAARALLWLALRALRPQGGTIRSAARSWDQR
jgi:hypothetical protein